MRRKTRYATRSPFGDPARPPVRAHCAGAQPSESLGLLDHVEGYEALKRRYSPELTCVQSQQGKRRRRHPSLCRRTLTGASRTMSATTGHARAESKTPSTFVTKRALVPVSRWLRSTRSAGGSREGPGVMSDEPRQRHGEGWVSHLHHGR